MPKCVSETEGICYPGTAFYNYYPSSHSAETQKIHVSDQRFAECVAFSKSSILQGREGQSRAGHCSEINTGKKVICFFLEKTHILLIILGSQLSTEMQHI